MKIIRVIVLLVAALAAPAYACAGLAPAASTATNKFEPVDPSIVPTPVTYPPTWYNGTEPQPVCPACW